MDFANIYAQGFARVAARVPPVKLADPAANAAAIIEDVKALAADGVCLAVYPELSLTGVTCGDLTNQDALLDAVEDAIATLVEASGNLLTTVVVGAPLRWDGVVYNCAVIIRDGRVHGFVPQVDSSEVPPEARYAQLRTHVELAAHFDPQLISQVRETGVKFVVQVGEDVPVAIAEGVRLVVCLGGAPATVGQSAARKLMAHATSLASQVAYVMACAGPGESTTDASWDGQAIAYECGELLGESQRFPSGPSGVTVDVDVRRLGDDHFQGFNPPMKPGPAVPTGDIGLRRPLARYPFVPNEDAALDQTCFEVAHIQLTALARRLESVGPNTKVVLGVSGGLDSTNAILAAAGAMYRLGRPMTDILAFTMPGFATSEGTKSNAWRLMKAVGVTAEEIDIRPAARQMMKDLGHPEDQYDVTFENIQAGLRADYLFRAANQRGGIVLGTGDLSESALGWCTYGVGDHISHYDVNAGLPKTLMQYVIRWYISQHMIPGADEVLQAILDQEISPELVPVKKGEKLQSSEAAVGPYPLNDFFLAHMLADESPSRIAYLAWQAWGEADAGAWPPGTPDDQRVAYDLATIKAWLGKFYQRFFASQFKRSASVDGPQVLQFSLSPRGGWAMPSDVKPDAWLAELTNVPDKL